MDGTLAFRRSCAHGVCGSDAMRINGRNRLACKVLVKDLGSSEITVEPMLGLRVIKDLIVDMEPFFEHYRSVLPYLINDDHSRPMARSACNRRSSASALTTPPSASCARPAPPPARPSGRTPSMLARRRSSTRTALSSTAATRVPRERLEVLNEPIRRLALPHHLQLHRGLPARDQDHPGHRRGEAGAGHR